ncbi:MAG: ATP-binding cassette domain-containing protein [Candidatus Heimdallarchaeota archaeon]
MKSYFIETYDLNKWYKEVMALNKVTVKIDRGIVGLLGPNGAGKSTFLNIATAQLRQSSGEIYVEGHEVWNNPTILKQFGLDDRKEICKRACIDQWSSKRNSRQSSTRSY